MNVFIHALNARLGGGQTYLYNLLNHLPQELSLHITLLVPSSTQPLPLPANVQIKKGGRWLEYPFIRAVWERLYLPVILRKVKPDVLFCPGGVIATRAPKGCKVVTMFRNMLPFDMKQRRRYAYGYKRLRNWMLERIMLSSMRNADLVIFISEHARKIIDQRLAGKIPKTVVIPHGINNAFRKTSVTESKHAWLPQGDYLLYVSSIDVYKMQVEVVSAFALLNPLERDLKLVLVGPEINKDYSQEVNDVIARHGIGDAVLIPGSVSYDKLPQLYQNASINIFASECENCPNILLEMMASGRPVVCSNYPPMPEFGGDTVVYFDPENPDTLTHVLEKLLDNPEQQERLATLALEKSNEYRWDDAAGRTWQAIAALTVKQT
jgi:glycosyltransferase involved in cell wall biosynthesis